MGDVIPLRRQARWVRWARVAVVACLAYVVAALAWTGVGMTIWGWDLIEAPHWFLVVWSLWLFTAMFVGGGAVVLTEAINAEEGQPTPLTDIAVQITGIGRE